MTDSLYAENIDFLAANKKDEEFFNSSEAHAQIVLSSMVKYSNKDVNIYCGNMCTDVSNDPTYLKEIKSFLDDRNGTINVLLCDYNDSFKEKEIYKLLSAYIPLKVKVKKTKKVLLFNNKPVHFTISDSSAFRLETDIDAKMARGNFNDPNSAIKLNEYFFTLFNQQASTEV